MYTHRRYRHPQLTSPTRSPFPPSQGPPFFGNLPHPQNTYYGERQTLEDPRRDYLGYAAPRCDRDSDDDHSHSTHSYIHWPPGPSYWEATQRARLPAHYLPSPWRDTHRARLRYERDQSPDTPFEIIPSIENDEQPSPVFPETQWASDSSWTSLPTPVSETFTLRSPSFSDDDDSISELHDRRRHPRNQVPNYVRSTPGSSPFTSPSLPPSSEDMNDRSATAQPPTPPRRRQRAQSPSPPPPSVSAHLLALPFRLSRQAGNPHLLARILTPPASQAPRVDTCSFPRQPQRCRCGECFCRNLLDRNGGIVVVEEGRFCAFCRENHCWY
ncbi:hypothetical protein CFIO01_07197 [Colletotrichum fioriniae PJ7]|uniref:Uncharacterized protein n=1 Tax=Colletotrichum fioriniae PJ7 TaxID=1445577 RepID=A0A010QX98_9PEZI|nr:hypothetical protein CFIO01_07197 [Colletotrichum fioriniae PJ7]